MHFQVRIAEPALADFEEILEYSWLNFPDTAERFGASILDHLELLCKFPYVGSPVAGAPAVRQVVHTPILIYYRIHEEHRLIEVLHFWHGQRRQPELGEQDQPPATGTKDEL